MGQPSAWAEVLSFACPSWTHAPGERRTIKATIGKRVVAALWSARLLRDVTNYAFYKDATVQVAPPDPNGSGAAVPCGDHTAALCVP